MPALFENREKRVFWKSFLFLSFPCVLNIANQLIYKMSKMIVRVGCIIMWAVGVYYETCSCLVEVQDLYHHICVFRK